MSLRIYHKVYLSPRFLSDKICSASLDLHCTFSSKLLVDICCQRNGTILVLLIKYFNGLLSDVWRRIVMQTNTIFLYRAFFKTSVTREREKRRERGREKEKTIHLFFDIVINNVNICGDVYRRVFLMKFIRGTPCLHFCQQFSITESNNFPSIVCNLHTKKKN